MLCRRFPGEVSTLNGVKVHVLTLDPILRSLHGFWKQSESEKDPVFQCIYRDVHLFCNVRSSFRLREIKFRFLDFNCRDRSLSCLFLDDLDIITVQIMTLRQRFVRVQMLKVAIAFTLTWGLFPNNNTKHVSSSVTPISTIVSEDNYSCSSRILRCIHWYDTSSNDEHWEFHIVHDSRSIDRSEKYSANWQTNWMDPILDLVFQTNLDDENHTNIWRTRWSDSIRPDIWETQQIGTEIVHLQTLLWWILMKSCNWLLREYTQGEKKKRSTSVWLVVDKFQSSDDSLFRWHSDYGQVVGQNRNSSSFGYDE